MPIDTFEDHVFERGIVVNRRLRIIISIVLLAGLCVLSALHGYAVWNYDIGFGIATAALSGFLLGFLLVLPQSKVRSAGILFGAPVAIAIALSWAELLTTVKNIAWGALWFASAYFVCFAGLLLSVLLQYLVETAVHSHE